MKLDITTGNIPASLLRNGDIITHEGNTGGASDVRHENGIVKFNIGLNFTRYHVKESDYLALVRRPMITNIHSNGKPFWNPYRKPIPHQSL